MTKDEQPAVESIAFDLESEDESTRRAAVFAAARLGEKAVPIIPILQRLAGTDTSIEIRYLCRKTLNALAATAKGAENTGRPRKSADMTTALSVGAAELVALRIAAPDPNTRASAYRAAALRRDPELLAPLLLRVGPEKEPDPELRALLVRVLAIVGEKNALKAVASFINDPDSRVRANCVETLSGYKEVTAYALIVRSLADKDHRVVTTAVKALAAVGSISVIKIATAMMKSTTAWSRDSAAYLLAGAKIPEALPLLVAGLQDSYEAVQIKCRAGILKLAELGYQPAVEALAKITGVKEVEEPLDFASLEEVSVKPGMTVEDQISDPNLASRRSYTKLVATAGMVDDGQIPALAGQLKIEKDVEVTENLIVALAKVRNPIVIPMIVDHVKHPAEKVRMAVCDAMGIIGTEEAYKTILPLLDDPYPAVAGRAILALSKTSGIDVAAKLTKLATGNIEAKKLACMLVGELKDARFLQVVEQLAIDKEKEIAEMAQEIANSLRALAPAASAPTAPIRVSSSAFKAITGETKVPTPKKASDTLKRLPQAAVVKIIALLGREMTNDEVSRLDSINPDEEDLNVAIEALQHKKGKIYSSDQIIYEYESIQRVKKQDVSHPQFGKVAKEKKKKSEACEKCGGSGYILTNQSVRVCDCKK